MSWWLLSLFQLSVILNPETGSFINKDLSQEPVTGLLWLSVVDKLRRNYRLFFACKLMCNNGKYFVRETFFFFSPIRTDARFPSKKASLPSSYVGFCWKFVISYFSTNKKEKHWPISLENPVVAEWRGCACCTMTWLILQFPFPDWLCQGRSWPPALTSMIVWPCFFLFNTVAH